MVWFLLLFLSLVYPRAFFSSVITLLQSFRGVGLGLSLAVF